MTLEDHKASFRRALAKATNHDQRAYLKRTIELLDDVDKRGYATPKKPPAMEIDTSTGGDPAPRRGDPRQDPGA